MQWKASVNLRIILPRDTKKCAKINLSKLEEALEVRVVYGVPI